MDANRIISNVQIGPTMFLRSKEIHPALMNRMSFYLVPEIINNFYYVEGMTLESVLTQYGIPFEVSPSPKLEAK